MFTIQRHCSGSMRKEHEGVQVPLRKHETALRFRAKGTSERVKFPYVQMEPQRESSYSGVIIHSRERATPIGALHAPSSAPLQLPKRRPTAPCCAERPQFHARRQRESSNCTPQRHDVQLINDSASFILYTEELHLLNPQPTILSNFVYFYSVVVAEKRSVPSTAITSSERHPTSLRSRRGRKRSAPLHMCEARVTERSGCALGYKRRGATSVDSFSSERYS